MGVLDNLKIPRGDRSDWAAKEYLLIDNVSINKTEIDNAKEGYSSLLQNLNTKYASKTYVQLAIASPNPSEIVISDIGISPSDVGKVGYSLQINNAGTGLIFSNTYKLGNGDLINPALSFSTGVNMGLYASTATNTEILNFKLNGSAVANITTNTVSGVSTLNLGSVVLSSNGGISTTGDITCDTANVTGIAATGDISTTGDITCVTANVTDIVATGTSSTFAGAEIGALSTTGPSIFSGSVKFNYSPNTVYIANTFPYSVNNFILAGYSNVQQAIDCNNSPTFTTSPTTGPRSTGFVQTFIGLDTEAGRATQVFYDGINKRLSMRYYNGTAWDASWVGFAREQGHANNQFFAADATDGKHVVNLGQMNAAIASAGLPTSTSASIRYPHPPDFTFTTPGTGTFDIPAGRIARVLVKAAGGPGGVATGAVPTVTPGTNTTLGISGNNIVTAYPGYAGLSHQPYSDSISFADFNSYSIADFTSITAIAGVFTNVLLGTYHNLSIGPYRGTNAYSNPPLFGGTIWQTAGKGGVGGINNPTALGQVGQPGGWVLLTIDNQTVGTLTIDYTIGTKTTATAGNPGTDGAVVVWLNNI